MGQGRAFFIVVGLVGIALLALAAFGPIGPGDEDELADVDRPIALEDAGHGAITFTLDEVGDAKADVIATIAPDGARTTRIGLETNVPTGIPQPAHVHRGSCSAPLPEPVFVLEPLTNVNKRLGQSETRVEVPLATLTTGEYVIDVHRSAEPPSERIVCGRLPEAAGAAASQPPLTRP